MNREVYKYYKVGDVNVGDVNKERDGFVYTMGHFPERWLWENTWWRDEFS